MLIGSNLYLPDELARHLLVIHHANHWIPLTTEEQRIACFNELLNNADTHKKYINLIQFLSINKEQVKAEVKNIIDDIWEKYPHFSSDKGQDFDAEDSLTILQILPVLILCLNDKRDIKN